MNLTIDKRNDIVYVWEYDTYKSATIGSINCAFGNIVDFLESKETPCQYSADDIKDSIIKALNGQDHIEHIYGMSVSIFSICHILHNWFNGNTQMSFTMKDLDIMRISSNITEIHKPITHEDYEYKDGMQFTINSVLDLLFSLLYFYTFEGLKIKRCHHCGKWFATSTLKTNYCARISPCSEMTIAGKPLLNAKEPCKQAVKTIRQRFLSRKDSIRQNFSTNHPDRLDDFYKQCADYLARYDKAPTIENIVAFHNYLYSDEMPRQSRPNRKSNREKRKLLGL
ncbi:MAG: hypothetical protein IKG82_10980 [Oscillospiraceae bacterium]|nr:hypothetical protein [Oscillospiraceae bacterium]